MAPPALPGREPSAGLRVDGLVQQVKQLRAEAKQLQAKNAPGRWRTGHRTTTRRNWPTRRTVVTTYSLRTDASSLVPAVGYGRSSRTRLPPTWPGTPPVQGQSTPWCRNAGTLGRAAVGPVCLPRGGPFTGRRARARRQRLPRRQCRARDEPPVAGRRGGRSPRRRPSCDRRTPVRAWRPARRELPAVWRGSARTGRRVHPCQRRVPHWGIGARQGPLPPTVRPAVRHCPVAT